MSDEKEWGDQSGGSAVLEKKPELKKPKLYNVLLHNDNYTTMEFVIMVLTNVFRLPQEQAVRVMLHVHNEGHGVAGCYTHEIAETKANKVSDLAKEYEYPLKATVEPA